MIVRGPAPDRIETERLLLRRFRADDRAAYLAIRAQVDVARALGYPPEEAAQKTDWFLGLNERCWSERGFGAWLVCAARDARPIGHAGLWYLESFDAVELLYGYAQQAWGRGLATEAARAVVDAAFEHVGLERLIALVAPDNARSRRVVEKLGFREVRTAEHRGIEVILHELDRTAPPAGVAPGPSGTHR
jgi:RimJ/RimL family protein N-acetyltransferase